MWKQNRPLPSPMRVTEKPQGIDCLTILLAIVGAALVGIAFYLIAHHGLGA